MLSWFFKHKLGHKVSITIVNHTVTEDSEVFVNPYSDQFNNICAQFIISRNNSLKNLAYITQVESVMRFARSWLQRSI